ncbi:MAG: hypothetical protein ACTHK5_09140 [Tsuneonella sp.]
MREPTPRASRLALASAVAVAIVVGGAGFLLGRATAPTPKSVPARPAPSATPEPAATLSGVLGRADLIALAAAAADRTAGGQPPAESLQAASRRFEVRLPFGCSGPAAKGAAGPMRWRYDSAAQALRIHVAPVTWTAADWSVDDSRVQAIEGFWIARPWTSSEACAPQPPTMQPTGPEAAASPAPSPEPAPTPAAQPTLALGQLFVAEGPRRGRRNGQAYEAVVRVPEAELDTSQGFRLRISGRIAPGLGGGPVACRASSPDQRPACLVAVIIDEVAIENPVSGETLAEWTLGGRNAPVAGASDAG